MRTSHSSPRKPKKSSHNSKVQRIHGTFSPTRYWWEILATSWRKTVNQSGIFPKGNRVLVLPDEIEEKTESGIVIPDTVKGQHAMAQTTGVLVAVGPDAWKHTTSIKYRMIDGSWKPVEKTVTGYSEPFAEPGQRVVFAKYGGLDVKGEDGKQYRILNDEDITTLCSDGVEFTNLRSRKALGT